MSDREIEFAANLSGIAEYILGLERRLKDLNEKFSHRAELQQLDLLQNTLT